MICARETISINSGVVVPKLLVSGTGLWPGSPCKIQATTVRLCTSSPAQHSYSTFMAVGYCAPCRKRSLVKILYPSRFGRKRCRLRFSHCAVHEGAPRHSDSRACRTKIIPASSVTRRVE